MYGELQNENFILNIPFEQASCSVCLHTAERNFLALSLNDAIKHATQRHEGSTLIFKCTNCDKEYVSKHAAQCHRPKCTGRVVPPPGAVRCDICGAYYKSKMGLSQHERTAHPDVRNKKRAGTSNADQRERRVRQGGFTKEEVDLMLTLERRFHGHPYVAKMMEEHLDRTAKQLRDKRALPSYKALREKYLRDNPPDESSSSEDSNPAESSDDSEIIGQEEEVTPPATPEAEVSETPPALVEAIDLEIPIVVPEIVVTPPQDSSSPSLVNWREGIIRNALEQQLPKKAFPDESQKAFSLLKGALQLAKDMNYEVPQLYVDNVYTLATSFLASRNNEDGGEGRPQRVRGKGRSRRRYIYARTQDLFKKNPGEVAKHVRNNIDWVEAPTQPNIADVRELYEKLWGTKPVVQLPDMGHPEAITSVERSLPPFTISEISKRVSQMKKNTAPGLDGIKRGDIIARDRKEVLRLLFNFLMLCGKQPTEWRKNRTTLLPKPGKDASKVENLRPITISSIISRLYWGCIDQKLRTVVRFSPRQKGFVSEPGCFNNIHILAEVLRHSKTTSKNLVVTVLDVSKAFDTVPHAAVGPSLRSKGLPPAVVRMVEDSYQDVNTTISSSGGNLEIKLQRGVKQGDPLSPLIFNAILEPLLLKLESQSGYRVTGDTHISSLAFADDLVLLSDNVQQAARQLLDVEAYLSGLGMNLSASKCATFHIIPKNKSWSVADPGLRLQSGEPIPYCGADGSFTYLGVEISPWAGIKTESIRVNLAATLARVKKLALKPHQKIELISTYLIPHYLYQLGVAVPPMTAIRQIDQDVRVVVRDILHLVQSTTESLLYCAKRDGGLGFPRIETLVVGATLRAGLKFTNSADPAIRALAGGAGLVDRLARLARGARLPWPLTERDLRQYKLRAKKQELQKWSALGSQGKSVASLTDDKIANAWLYSPSLLKPCRYITALKMRTNTCPTRVALNRAGPQPDLKCRQCHARLETLGHILGECTATKAQRIRRHDEICDLIMEEVTKQGRQVAVVDEPTVRDPQQGNLKPDLVVKSQEGVRVVDVTVRHEDGDSLARGRNEKLNKYNPLLPALQQKLKVTAGVVLPIVVGTRGAMPKETVKCLAKLGIKDDRTLKTISLIALRSSIEIYHNFMDYDAPLQRLRRRRPNR